MPGVRCSQRAVAIGRVGLYIPGGNALFSTVLMLLRWLRSPAAPKSSSAALRPDATGRSPRNRYAAALCGVRRVFALGGRRPSPPWPTAPKACRASTKSSAGQPLRHRAANPSALEGTGYYRPPGRPSECWCSPTKEPRPTSRPPTCSRRPNTAATVRRCSSAAASRSHAA